MSQVEDPTPSVELSEKDELAIRKVAETVDFGKLLVDDYLDLDVEVIPGHLTVTYRTAFGGDVFDMEDELENLDSLSQSKRYHYSVFRSLAVSVQRINGDLIGKNDEVPAKIEYLKRKPQQIIEKIFWGFMVAREAVQKWIDDPEMMEGAIKKS